jgi:hypothetical protein
MDRLSTFLSGGEIGKKIKKTVTMPNYLLLQQISGISTLGLPLS